MHVHALIDRDYGGYAKIYYLGSSAPAFSLFFSNSEANFYYSAALEKLFPDVYFYDLFSAQFSDWYNHPVPFSVISRSHDGRVVFQGPPFAQLKADISQGETAPDGFKAPPVPLTEAIPAGDDAIYKQRQETIYVVRPPSSPSS
jgi:hypothetical protein